MVRNSDSWLPVIPDYRPKVAHIVRNRWLHYSGMSGTHKPEQVAGLERNTQPQLWDVKVHFYGVCGSVTTFIIIVNNNFTYDQSVLIQHFRLLSVVNAIS